jgi:RNAse (barnase) inhibitor barstar
MKKLDALLDVIEQNSKKPLKSEKAFMNFRVAKNKLDKNITNFASILDHLSDEQLKNLNFNNK